MAAFLDSFERPLDYATWEERKPDCVAAIQAGTTDYEPMQELVKRALRETAANADE